MTFWHSLVSFKAHLAHLPSPVIVMLSPAARVRTVVVAHINAATLATNANDFFIVRFLLVRFAFCQHLLTLNRQISIGRVQTTYRQNHLKSSPNRGFSPNFSRSTFLNGLPPPMSSKYPRK